MQIAGCKSPLPTPPSFTPSGILSVVTGNRHLGQSHLAPDTVSVLWTWLTWRRSPPLGARRPGTPPNRPSATAGARTGPSARRQPPPCSVPRAPASPRSPRAGTHGRPQRRRDRCGPAQADRPVGGKFEMLTLCDPPTRDAIHARVDGLDVEQAPRWGKMDARQMVCHVSDQLRVALGDIESRPGPLRLRFGDMEVKTSPGPLRFRLYRQLMVHWAPWPKARIKAPAAIRCIRFPLAPSAAAMPAASSLPRKSLTS